MILDAASDLFYRNGYANVGMGDVAEAVAIGPSALYRHFRGKQEMLATVLGDAVAKVDLALVEAAANPSSNVAGVLAATALEGRTGGLLRRRESRHLSTEARADHRRDARRIVAQLGDLIHIRRPELTSRDADLLARCALSAANSISFHTLALPEAEFTALLTELIASVIDADLPAGEAVPRPEQTGTWSVARSRQESILIEATTLFAEDGFSGVSMEDIGARVGIAGPSIYNHFASKTDILSAAMTRGGEWLRMDMIRALASATDPRDGVLRLLHSYCEFVFANPHLVQILVSESVHLPDPDANRAVQREYIAEWVQLMRDVHPSMDAVRARIRVQAAQTMMNDAALTRHTREYPGIAVALESIGAGLLGITD